MPVDTPHPKVAEVMPLWAKVRTCVGGEESVKAEGERFLPRPSGLERPRRLGASDEYEHYLGRAWFHEAPSRTVQGLSGLLNRKPATIEGAPDDFSNEVTKKGEGIDYLAATTFVELVGVGRRGFLVDYDEDGDRAFVATYPAESILEVREVAGKPVDVRLLEERLEPKDSDPFKFESVTTVRRLRFGMPFGELSVNEIAALGEEPSAEDVLRFHGLNASEAERGVYFVEIYVPVKKKRASNAEQQWVLTERIVPRKRGGAAWEEVPFKVANSTDCDAAPKRPPLLGICNLSLAHYRNAADLEWGTHWAALPTAWASGFNLNTGETLTVGSGHAWVSAEPNARAGYLEIKGDGLKIIRESMADKTAAMANLGARMLEGGPSGVEAAETVKLRMAGDSSFLAHVAANTKEALDAVVGWLADARLVAGELTVNVARDLDVSKISPEEMREYVAAFQTGSMSFSTFFSNLKRGEVYPEDWTEDDERLAIENTPMPGAPSGVTDGLA